MNPFNTEWLHSEPHDLTRQKNPLSLIPPRSLSTRSTFPLSSSNQICCLLLISYSTEVKQPPVDPWHSSICIPSFVPERKKRTQKKERVFVSSFIITLSYLQQRSLLAHLSACWLQIVRISCLSFVYALYLHVAGSLLQLDSSLFFPISLLQACIDTSTYFSLWALFVRYATLSGLCLVSPHDPLVLSIGWAYPQLCWWFGPYSLMPFIRREME